MTDQSTTANAGAEESPVANTNMSVTEFANRRLGEMTQEVQEQTEPQEEVTEETEEQVTEEVTDGVDEIQEETEEVTENEEDVLSQIDLDTMSEDELRDLSEKLGSKAVARFGALTAKRKAAEERLAELEAKLSQRNPLDAPKKVDNNPFSNIDTIRAAQHQVAA